MYKKHTLCAIILVLSWIGDTKTVLSYQTPLGNVAKSGKCSNYYNKETVTINFFI